MSTNQLYWFLERLQKNRHVRCSWVTYSLQENMKQRSEWKDLNRFKLHAPITFLTLKSENDNVFLIFVQLLPEMDSWKDVGVLFRIQSRPMDRLLKIYLKPGDSTTFIHDFGVGFSYCWTYTYHQLFYHCFSVSWLLLILRLGTVGIMWDFHHLDLNSQADPQGFSMVDLRGTTATYSLLPLPIRSMLQPWLQDIFVKRFRSAWDECSVHFRPWKYII